MHGLDDDAICEIGAEVAAAGGLLVAAGTGGSYALVPLDWDMQAPVEMVTVFWIVSTVHCCVIRFPEY